MQLSNVGMKVMIKTGLVIICFKILYSTPINHIFSAN